MSEGYMTGQVAALLQCWNKKPENLLQILIGLQQQFHHISGAVIDQLSDGLKLTSAEIESVVDFYSFLHRRPAGEYEVLFSDNIVDRMLGGREQAERLSAKLNVGVGEVRQDGRVRLGYTSCSGMGDQGPAALINGYAVPRLTTELIDHMTGLIEAGIPLNQWPLEFFSVDMNLRRKDLLLESAWTDGLAIDRILELGAESLLVEIENSGLRGRGGAGFSTAKKWGLCRDEPAEQRVVVCNADEGEPGTFKDRVLLQGYAGHLIEGMTLCAAVVGADCGFIYLRGEYLYLRDTLERELQRRREIGLLGRNIGDRQGFDFDIEIHLGAGAYICGEESALLESLEGRRGIPRNRPPFPVTHGYLGRPTVVNNVETFIATAMIVVHGAEWFRSQGTEVSPGTKLLSVSGDCEFPGVYEYPYGVSIADVLRDCGANAVQAVQIAGPAGRCVPPSEFDRKIAFEDLATGGSFMIFGRDRDLLQVVENFSAFFVHESCGFCTPCRVGTTLIEKRLQKVLNGHATTMDLDALKHFGALMRNTSHCGLGATAANPVLSTLEKFPHIYEGRLRNTRFEPAFDLNEALDEARKVTGRDDPGAFLKGGGV